MWAQVKNGQVIKIFNGAQAFKIGDYQYSSGVFSKWSKSELAEIGVYPVQQDRTNYKNTEYHRNTTHTYTVDDKNKVVKMTWGKATAHSLVDVEVKDEDGKNILDADGNKIINEGLKTVKKKQINDEAQSILNNTDWYVIKASEVSDYTLPTNIAKFRAAVRTKCNAMQTQIDNASDVDALKTLYEYTNTGTEESPDMTRPLGEFPKLEDF
tara:strand:+ start:2111 stop:2743 length:633 start_codon:yes stop_codon:yes gene_type:complete